MPRTLPTLDEYIDDALRAINGRRDADLNRALHLSRSAASQWRTGRSYPSDEAMIQLARMGGHDERLAVLQCQQWRAAGSQNMAVYKVIGEILATMTRTAAMLLFMGCLGVAMTGGTNPVQAASPSADTYIMRHYGL